MLIREAVAEDAALILGFVQDLARYERAEDEVVATVADIQASIFGGGATAKAIIGELDGEPVGFAVYFYNYSTWLGKKGLYLEDLYIAPAYRGKGSGKAMLQYLAKQAVSENCGRFEWSVLGWNEPAIQFYQSIGATPKSEWVGYQLAGPALSAFAGDHQEGIPDTFRRW
ncbi:GNAT family N-acetyltransferase [Endozoicomonas sp. ONNA2]|uniref:GNAT family N-acetyltransferase n=1 Tax=Endozoicomonas sp. ONNA2 TaxID=2828741 RepID=UPI0027D2BAC9|nr:GNAT family N-acetyltransferase [Endozoicomonas sp. ONNA2]